MMKKRSFLTLLLAMILLCALALPASAVVTAKQDRGSVVEIVDQTSFTRKYIVFYPEELETTSNKTWPVVVWANGTLCIPAVYTDLLQRISNAGYIVVASDVLMSANGNAQRDAINYIVKQNEKSSSVFYQKVDTAHIAAAGHSQGGRSSVNAAAADSRISCVVSVAGSNYDYEAKKLSTPTFFIGGSYDLIVPIGQWILPAYDACTGPAVFAALDGGFHTTAILKPAEIAEYSVKWLNAWLRGDSGALAAFLDGGALSSDDDWGNYQSKNMPELRTGSTLSGGSIALIVCLACVVIIGCAVAVTRKKRKAGTQRT